jgi:copper chaperone CopZ
LCCKCKIKPVSIDGVKEIKVSLQNKNATAKYDPEMVNPTQLKNTINKIGYKAGDIEETNE